MDAYYFKDKDGFYYDIICINQNTNTITGVADSGIKIDFNLSDVTLFDTQGNIIDYD